MPEHSLEQSLTVIDGLAMLGLKLGYHVAYEFPIEKDKENPQVVDVAWLLEEGQDFPLMIFEVESRASNTIANNPVKVYGKLNQSFEKPLFFFHVMLSTGRDTSRINDLVGLFGRHNYRAYRLDTGDVDRLVRDVLSQHRRITRKLNIRDLISTLESEYWVGVDINSVLLHAEQIGFERGTGRLLPQYAYLWQFDPRFGDHFVRYLQRRDQTPGAVGEKDEYPTYLGGHWSVPLHLGILCFTSHEISTKESYFARLRNWQEEGFIRQIGPFFGLDKDYDKFILGSAAFVWGLVSLLMSDIPEAVNYICRQCRWILKEIETQPSRISLFTALWLLHASASTDICEEFFNDARSFINERGGVPERILYEPPGIIDIDHDHHWLEDRWNPNELVPEIDEFTKVEHYADEIAHKPVEFAIRSLADGIAQHRYGPELAILLNRITRK